MGAPGRWRAGLTLTRPDVLILAGLTALAAALRFATLDLQSLSFDESVTAVVVVRPGLSETLAAIPQSESTPPLYYLLTWLWTKVFGTGEVGLRSLSALVGTLTVPAIYLAARSLVSSRAGLIAAGLVATSPMLVRFSQEARAYALMMLLCAVAMAGFARAREGSKAALATWAVASALALLTHYFAVILVAPTALWLLATSGRTRVLRTGIAVAAPLITGLALVPLAAHQERDGRTAWIDAVDLRPRVEGLVREFVAGTMATPGDGLGAAAFAIVAIALILLAARGRGGERRGGVLALAIGAAALGLAFAFAAAGLDFFLFRNLMPAWIALAIGVAAGLGARRAGRAGVAAAACLMAVWVAINVAVLADEAYHREDWRELARLMGEPRGPRAVFVIPAYAGAPLTYYGQFVQLPPQGGLQTREIVVVGTYPAATAAEAFPGQPAFRLVERRSVRGLGLLRYRATTPQRVPVPPPGGPGLLVQ